MFRAILVALLGCVCGIAAEKDWWETALIYQIYPRSFMDSDGDGIGDLNGITSKLQYLKDTGIDAIWMSPIFLSSMYDFGYDITDYRQIAAEYGTMADFDNLMTKSKSLGIRVLLDYVPNHTSNESEWFVKSAKRDIGYENYYIWADGTDNPDDPSKKLPPNNWVSHFWNSAWEWNPERGQFYLHQFAIAQPDLNYRSSSVQKEMKDVLRFWLDKGVSGFRVDAINMLYEVDSADFGGKYPDEPLSGIAGATPNEYTYLKHIYTRDLEETYDVVYDWRDVLNEYTNQEHKIMLTEAYASLNNMIKYYGNGQREGSIPFNFAFLDDINKDSNAKDIKVVIDQWMTYMPTGKTANWLNGNHDQSRLATRLGVERLDAMNMLALLLPGIAITYQGEEIGMTDGEVSWEETKDPQACNTGDPINYSERSRDPERTPYHWDSTTNAGFSTNANGTWLPVASNYKQVNLAIQMAADRSHYKFYKDLVSIRKSNAVRNGDLETRAVSQNVLAIARLQPGAPAVVGVVNLSNKDETADLSSLRTLPSQLRVVAAGVDSKINKGTRMKNNAITVSANSVLVLQSFGNVPIINVLVDVNDY